MAEYRGKEVRLRAPRKIPGVTPADKKKTVYVRDPKTGKVRMIHFGAASYPHNYSKAARASYLARSAKIRDASGRLTKDNPLSPNFWSRRELWRPGGPKKSRPR